MKAIFTKFSAADQWVSGVCIDTDSPIEYNFSAKLFDEGSPFGIKEGRVSKLSIGIKGQTSDINYDRGWDLKPTKHNRKVFNEIMTLLENSPKRF